MTKPATPNHALQRTRAAVTPAASCLRLSPATQRSRQPRGSLQRMVRRCSRILRTAFLLLLLCVASSLFAATHSADLYTVQSPSGSITISLRKLRLSEDGHTRTTYFYVVRQSLRSDLLYLPSALEDSLDGEHTKFRQCITLHWSPSETAFVLRESFPADSPCGRLHIVGSPRSSLQAIPYDTTMPANVARDMKKHPERFYPYAPQTVVRVTDTEATIDFSYYRYTYRYAERGVPRQ